MKFKLFGIYINIDILFLIMFFVFLFSPTFYTYFFNFYITYIFIVFHEVSHVLVATIFSNNVYQINISLCGINVQFLEKYIKNTNYIKNIIVFCVGPISNLCLALLFFKIKFIFEINIFLCFLNLLPIAPLDGYNILKNFIYIFKLSSYKVYFILKLINNIIFIIFFISSLIIFFINKNVNFLIFTICIFIIQMLSKKN